MDEEINKIIRALECGNRVFIIRGAAGTGKTTLVKRLIPMLRGRGVEPSLLAPTGRAALVLSKRTGFSAGTIHSGIFNIVDDPIKDESGSALKWIFPLKKDKDVEDVAFIVDESSMVGLAEHDNDRELFQFGSGSLLNDLIEFSGVKVSGTSNLLFFVGDSFQLPPVGDRCETPPALDEVKLKELTGFTPYVLELSKVHRQDQDSGILTEAVKIRDSLIAKDFNILKFSEHRDVSVEDSSGVVTTWDSLEELDDKIIIAQTNARVREYNDEARNHFNLLDDLPMRGERLLSIRNTRMVLQDGARFQIYNGDFLRVIDVPNAPLFELQGFYRPKNSNETFHFKYVFKKMSFSWVYEPERGEIHDEWMNVTPIVYPEWDLRDNYAAVGLYNGVKQYIEERLRERYPNFRKDRTRKNYWDVMVRQELKDSIWLHAPIVKYGYAVTGHKSQGGEWDEVWADYSCGSNMQSSYYFRWAYTATTRARKHLHVLCAPQIDALSKVFLQNIIHAGASEERAGNHTPCKPTLITRLMEEGYVIGDVLNQSEHFKYRILLTHNGSGVPGWIDVMYKKNGIISFVNARVDPLPGWLSEFKGRSVKEAIGSVDSMGKPSGSTNGGTITVNISSEQKRRVLERIIVAIERCSFQVISIRECTQYQVRLEIATANGNGFIDLYFDRKERLTSRNSSLSADDMNKLACELNRASESSEGN